MPNPSLDAWTGDEAERPLCCHISEKKLVDPEHVCSADMTGEQWASNRSFPIQRKTFTMQNIR